MTEALPRIYFGIPLLPPSARPVRRWNWLQQNHRPHLLKCSPSVAACNRHNFFFPFFSTVKLHPIDWHCRRLSGGVRIPCAGIQGSGSFSGGYLGHTKGVLFDAPPPFGPLPASIQYVGLTVFRRWRMMTPFSPPCLPPPVLFAARRGLERQRGARVTAHHTDAKKTLSLLLSAQVTLETHTLLEHRPFFKSVFNFFFGTLVLSGLNRCIDSCRHICSFWAICHNSAPWQLPTRTKQDFYI